MKKIFLNHKIFATFSINNRTVTTKNGKTMINLISSIVAVKEDYKINLNNLVDRLKILECKEITLCYITPLGTPFDLTNRKENKLFYKPLLRSN
jgi:hypothetical protein